jgi:uncharacterized protein (TIGR02271 family)
MVLRGVRSLGIAAHWQPVLKIYILLAIPKGTLGLYLMLQRTILEIMHMTLRTLMQAGPVKANELFTRLAATSDTALKTREKLFTELKGELEEHTVLEEQHLFPVLRKHPETKELVAAAIKDNKDLRVAIADLEAFPKNDESFLSKLADLRKAFRQHARDETKELLPAVQKALSEEQVQGIVEKMEGSLAEADQARQSEADERRAAARREREEREEAELQAQQKQEAEQEREAAARRTEKAAREAAKATIQATAGIVDAAAQGARQVARTVAEGASRVTAQAIGVTGEAVKRTGVSAAPRTGMFFWDMMLGMSGVQPGQAAAIHEANAPVSTSRHATPHEEVIPLAEEVLVVGKRTVNTGTTRIRRYVVETAVEQEVSLMRERVVVERRRPVANEVTGEVLTELTVEMVETDEVPVIAKSVQLREEVVVRTERMEHVETVRETVRQDEVEIEHANTRQRARARS